MGKQTHGGSFDSRRIGIFVTGSCGVDLGGMMKKQLAVIIGRFQAPYLHSGYFDLFTRATEMAERVLILVGYSAEAVLDQRNPLPVNVRIRMIESEIQKLSQFSYSQFVVLPLPDCRTNTEWTAKINALIKQSLDRQYQLDTDVILLGGRSSSVEAYEGPAETHTIVTGNSANSTDIRESYRGDDSYIELQYATDYTFRAGMVYAQMCAFPRVFPTVDVIAVSYTGCLLVGQKPNDPKHMWRFPGGFVDPNDSCLEAAAVREFAEETKLFIEANALQYQMSKQLRDWRYRGSVDTIHTTVFTTHMSDVFMREAQAGDDLAAIRIVPLQEWDTLTLVPEHQNFFNELRVKNSLQLKG